MKSVYFAYGLILASNALPAAAQTTASSAPAPVVAQVEHRGPDFDKAITNLNRMVARLNADPHDYAGHRVAAIKDLQAAIVELTAARAVVNP
jgi:hypothetical protein